MTIRVKIVNIYSFHLIRIMMKEKKADHGSLENNENTDRSPNDTRNTLGLPNKPKEKRNPRLKNVFVTTNTASKIWNLLIPTK